MKAEIKQPVLRLHELRLSLGISRASNDDLLLPRYDGQIRSPHRLTQKFALLMGLFASKALANSSRDYEIIQ
jgi:hypothetical protein